MNILRNRIVCFVMALAAVGVDQWSKFAVRAFMESRQGAELVLIPGFLSVIRSYNTGVAFGLFEGISIVNLFLPIVLVAAMQVFYFKYGKNRLLSYIGIGLMTGGAIGNLIDRIRAGRVFDFINAYIGTHSWPTFNAADSFIVIGVGLLAISFIRGEFDE